MDEAIGSKRLMSLFNLIATSVVAVLPVFFLTNTSDFYDFNKQALLLVVIGVLLLLVVFHTLVSKKVVIHRSSLDVPLFLFILTSLFSYYMASTNKIEALLTPLGIGTYVGLLVWFWVLRIGLKGEGRRMVGYGLLVSGALVGITVLAQFAGIMKVLFPSSELIKNTSWSPTGSLLVSVIYIVALLPLLIYRIQSVVRNRHYTQIVLHGSLGLFMGLAILIGGYQLITSAKPLLLSHTAGWSIAVESVKTHPLFGTGVENYLNAFTQGKPLGINTTSLWNTRFGLSSNAILHILTTLGLVGFAAFIIFILAIVRLAWLTLRKTGVEISLVVTVLLGFLFPPFFLYFFLLFTLASLETKEDSALDLTLSKNHLSSVISLVVVIVAGVILYQFSRYYAAEIYFKRSLDAIASNRGSDAYSLQRQAILTNPSLDKYRIAASQTNLLLAGALARKGNLSDQERSTATQLVDQSVKEAKNAISLSPRRVLGWENLARIYRELMSIVKDAHQPAIVSYGQAITLDPLNPTLRIELGGIYYGIGNFDEAIKQFGIAAQLKPDFANAYYNLSAAFKSKNDFTSAVGALERVLAVLPKESQDYEKARLELEELKKQVPVKEDVLDEVPQATESGQLTTPARPSPVLSPPLDLPPDADPPATESATPAPTALPTSSPTATQSPES